jgi:hypothetical protein
VHVVKSASTETHVLFEAGEPEIRRPSGNACPWFPFFLLRLNADPSLTHIFDWASGAKI